METLPTEVLAQILTQIPKSSLPSVRLACHAFNALSFPLLFSHIAQWLNYEVSHRAVISIANDAYNRPAVMWSPWATGPDGPVDGIWMALVWKSLMKSEAQGLSVFEPKGGEGNVGKEIGAGKRVLTAGNFAELSGMTEMSENRLRTGQNRFLLHRSYTEGTQEDWTGGLC
ncbi:hypothetical protein LSUE1_G002064 [Lachnellula suecica]|uniref:F-box domain-containing protein n=1 Tax=Lachnellula suecica TaxID=602035 RepID=A0A8T9CBA5_9HELO|nr:hypothetical protein LSUE1_G002064 [Lachnellula suecica]